MKRNARYFVLLSALFSVSLFAQSIPTEAQFAYDGIEISSIKTNLTYLAGEEPQGRGNGQPGLKLAADYIVDFYKELDLVPAGERGTYLQPYEIWKTKVASASLDLLFPGKKGNKTTFGFHNKVDFAIYGIGLSMNQSVTTDVVFAGYGLTNGSYDDYAGIKATGKIVLIVDGAPELGSGEAPFDGSVTSGFRQLRNKTRNAAAHGAAALIIVPNPGDQRLFPQRLQGVARFTRSRTGPVPSGTAATPTFLIRPSVARSILKNTGHTIESLISKIEGSGKPNSMAIKKIKMSYSFELSVESIISYNVAAILEGTDPELKDEYIVLSAHYDHEGVRANGDIYYGADDDGSGTVSVMEVAKAMANSPNKPRRSILFLNVSGEEIGLVGSAYFTNHPLVPIEDIIADINMDMVGRNAADSIYIIGSNMLSQDLHDINEAAAKMIPNMFLDYKYNDKDDPNRFYYRSDHYNFAKNNIPVVFYFNGVHADYHRPTDTVDKIDFAKIQKVSRLAFLTTWEVANRDERLRLNGVAVEE